MIPGQKQLSNLEELLEGVWKQNPVFVMVLGMCPALAVSRCRP
jgi:electron transport complex protein RnfE